MFNYNVSFYQRSYRKQANGKAPIYARIRIETEKLEQSTEQSIEPKYWNSKKQAVSKCPEAALINSVLSAFKEKAMQAITSLQLGKIEVTIDNVRKLLKGEEVLQTYTLLKVAHEHNDNFEKQVGKKYSAGSYKNYKTTLKYLIEFVPSYVGKKDIDLKAVNYRFCEAYFTFLTTSKQCHVNGANKQIQRVKKILNYAIRSGYIQNNPASSFTTEFTPVQKNALSMDEINRLAALELQREVLKNVRNVFLFQCYTGLSYSDIKQLSPNHLSREENDTVWIRMNRQKTSVSFAVPLLPIALAILAQYLPVSTEDKPLLPVISNQKMNDNLKILQELAGISKTLTSHIGRHSFACTITLNNGVPITTVSRMLGHTKLSTTQIYSKLLDTTVANDMKALIRKLTGN